VAEAKALYSASAEEHETVGCFFDFHETKDLPMKKQYPEMERRVSIQPPQSASLKPSNWSSEEWGKNKPHPGERFKYLNTLRAAL
jgi:hypothetical protein